MEKNKTNGRREILGSPAPPSPKAAKARSPVVSLLTARFAEVVQIQKYKHTHMHKYAYTQLHRYTYKQQIQKNALSPVVGKCIHYVIQPRVLEFVIFLLEKSFNS